METIRIRTEKQIFIDNRMDRSPVGIGTIIITTSATTLKEMTIPVILVVLSKGVAATAVALANNCLPPSPVKSRV